MTEVTAHQHLPEINHPMNKTDCLILPPKTAARKAAAKAKAFSSVTAAASPDERICIIFMHGLGADAEDISAAALELQRRIPSALLVLPNAPTMPVTLNGGVTMPSWYDILSLDPPHANCRDIGDVVRSVGELIAELKNEGYAERNIFVTGFSQGGSVALAYGLLAEVPPGGVACIAGFLPPCPELLRQNNNSCPILLMHGVRDETVPFKYCLETRDALRTRQPELKKYDLEHYIGMAELEDLSAWICRHTGNSPRSP